MRESEIYARPDRSSHGHHVDPVAARKRLDEFAAIVKEAVSRHRAANVGANSVVVTPGGRSFPTVSAALDSITDASQSRQYVVSIGPGTYTEVVTCKPWVFLTGAGRGQTIVTYGSQSDPTKKGTIKASSHSAVQECTIQSTPTGTGGGWVVAVDCQSAVDFDIENCELIATDPSNTMDVTGIALDDWFGTGSQVNISYTSVTANSGFRPLAINVYFAAYAHGMESKFIGQNGANPGRGGFAADASVFLVEDSYVEGADHSLYKDSNPKTSITANHCQLKGPVGPGVVVNP